ncbi:MAG: hypothetical protein EOP82_17260 [Variovorax sp.]|nr:MAG: hypothetical protein EOP82_17260 [Variovorax sp.]
MRTDKRTAFRLAAGLALAASLILVWLSLGVGIIGQDGDPANRMYFAVILLGIIGAAVARMQPAGMSYTLLAMAVVQASIGAIAVVTGLGLPWSGPAELLILNGGFVALFAGSAWLFRRASRG